MFGNHKNYETLAQLDLFHLPVPKSIAVSGTDGQNWGIHSHPWMGEIPTVHASINSVDYVDCLESTPFLCLLFRAGWWFGPFLFPYIGNNDPN